MLELQIMMFHFLFILMLMQSHVIQLKFVASIL